MTPILARFCTAALVGAASFVNCHPCAATAADRPPRDVMGDAASVSPVPSGRHGRAGDLPAAGLFGSPGGSRALRVIPGSAARPPGL